MIAVARALVRSSYCALRTQALVSSIVAHSLVFSAAATAAAIATAVNITFFNVQLAHVCVNLRQGRSIGLFMLLSCWSTTYAYNLSSHYC